MEASVLGFRVAKAAHGLGVFATENFEEGDLVGIVDGRIIDSADYHSDYCIDLGGTLSLEPTAPFRYLNHCCEPNCALYVVETESPTEDESEATPEVVIEVLRPVVPGEELTIDYAWPAECAIPCFCASPRCRGWIVTDEELGELPAVTPL